MQEFVRVTILCFLECCKTCTTQHELVLGGNILEVIRVEHLTCSPHIKHGQARKETQNERLRPKRDSKRKVAFFAVKTDIKVHKITFITIFKREQPLFSPQFY
jgi:hypothetical protein